MPDATAPRKPGHRRRRTRLAPAVRESAILDRARAIFEVQPYEAVTLEQVAAEAGVSPALVHHYFENKRGLFVAVVRQAIEGFLLALAPPPPAPEAQEPASTPREAVDGALRRYLRFIVERPNGYAFVIGARGAPDARVTELIGDGREVAYRAVLDLLGIADPSPRQALHVWGWIGAVEAASTRWLRDRTLPVEELRLLLLDLLLGGEDRV